MAAPCRDERYAARMPDPSGLPVPPRASFEPTLPADPNLVNLHDYERVAAERIAPGPLAYFAGGAGDEVTLRDNRAAFARQAIVPRVMRDVSSVDTSMELFGRRWPTPIWIAPTALQRMAHPDGELAVARAAAARGVTMAVSTSASTDIAEIAAVGGPRWFQVYLLADPGARRALVEGAVANGYEALLLTVDLARIGRRERDLRIGFRIPEGVEIPNVALAAGVSPADVASVAFTDRLTWTDLEWLTGFGLPVIVKGILHPDDARLAIEHGAAGIGVSNHGGRQLDASIASLDALPAIVDVVAGRVPILLDGGVRRGTDVVISLAMGATAVGIGRPILWGLAVDGEAGVGNVLDLLTNELTNAMALCGAASVAELTPELLA